MSLFGSKLGFGGTIFAVTNVLGRSLDVIILGGILIGRNHFGWQTLAWEFFGVGNPGRGRNWARKALAWGTVDGLTSCYLTE